MRDIHRIMREKLKELPQKLFEKTVLKKLNAAGVQKAELIAPQLAAHLLSGKEEKFIWDDGNEEDAPEIHLDFTREDIAEVERKALSIIQNELPKAIRNGVDEAAAHVCKKVKQRWPAQAEWQNNTNAIFQYNLEGRWGKGLDRLRMLLTLAREAGEDRLKRYSRLKSRKQPKRWQVLFSLHMRACQVTGEIIALLENGFADGAMARWRTLYEIGVVATTISDNDEDIAIRYITHELVEAKSAMDEYERSHAALGYGSYPKRDKQRILKGYEKAIARYGKEFGSTYGWAAHHLGRKKPIFPDLETAAGRTHNRPYYKMASYNVHAGAKGIFHRLSAIDPAQIIAGASNMGLTEPAQNTAFSIMLITSLLYGPRFTFKDLVSLEVMRILRDEIPAVFLRAERKRLRDDAKFIQEFAKTGTALRGTGKRHQISK